ncbi:hypothetical protein [Aeromicrobium massiliense]|uniref:hypothetical protein n=1 Tax=Aeromicrobium massiliense TaxID=1464554 RepID=UPI000315C52A|nr:hypothetical protein [Aeromicrobium massiliense]
MPVEQRFLGLDRRSLVPGLVVIGIWALWSVVVPQVDDAVAYDDTVRAGDRFSLTEDLAFTPPTGWNVVEGFRTTEEPAAGPGGQVQVSDGTLSVVVVPDDFDGTPSELLDQVTDVDEATTDAFKVEGERYTVTTRAGATGVAEGFTTPRSQGTITAFVIDGTGVEFNVVGTTAQLAAHATELTQMIESLGPWDAAPTEEGAS